MKKRLSLLFVFVMAVISCAVAWMYSNSVLPPELPALSEVNYIAFYPIYRNIDSDIEPIKSFTITSEEDIQKILSLLDAVPFRRSLFGQSIYGTHAYKVHIYICSDDMTLGDLYLTESSVALYGHFGGAGILYVAKVSDEKMNFCDYLNELVDEKALGADTVASK